MLVSVVSSIFLVFASLASGTTTGYFDLDTHELSFNQSKSVFIATSIGGSSHTKWVLEIGRILATRGHKITYVTRDDQLALADAFPEIQAVSTGGPVYNNILGKAGSKNFYEIAKVVRKFLNNAYKDDMKFYQNLFSTQNKPDFFICDAFNDPCIDTATELKIPFAITCTGILHQDIPVPYINSLGTTAHATSESMTMWERFHHKYVDLIKILYHLYPEMKELDDHRSLFNVKAVGLDRYKKWDNALKLINSYFGFQPSQILSPLTHMVGPVFSAKQKELGQDEAQFLNSHSKVAYVAFGQVAVPNKREIEILASALLDQIERKQLDGVIWVGLKRHVSLVEDGSWTLNTSTTSKTFTTAMFLKHLSQSFLMPTWASQFAVLAHDSTALFVSHGGAESANEATFNGVPILINPYYGDQRLVGRALTIAGVARVYDRATSTFDTVKKEMDTLLLDESQQVARNVSRMRVLAKMGSKRKEYAADLVEEHMFASDQGISHHRHEVSRNLSKIKSTDIDLHLTVLSFVVISGFTFYYISTLLF